MTPQRRRNSSTFLFPWFLVALSTSVHSSVCWAYGTGPFGAGLPDGGVPGETLFPRLASVFIASQLYFNQHMTTAILAIHRGEGAWTLLLLSFLYGVIHAIGPGHGKAVVSSYLLATRQTLRNGVLLAFVAAVAQALGAIVLIFVAVMVLHLTSVSITWATAQFAVASGVLVLLLGCWLVWSKIISPLRSANLGFRPLPAPITTQRQLALRDDQVRFQASAITEANAKAPLAVLSPYSADSPVMSRQFAVPHGAFRRLCACGQMHPPDLNMAVAGVDWRRIWPILGATGLRPCTGALIVLVFAISQQLWGIGILSTLLIGLGTAMTVSAIAILTVFAHRFALVLTSANSQFCHKIVRATEICGAIIVLAVGVLLVGGVL
jgi:nickel/cobalt transporter (NicO) family protein